MVDFESNTVFCTTEIMVSATGSGRRVEVIYDDDIEFILSDECDRVVAGLVIRYIEVEREQIKEER
ncbi:hypothetical protein KAU45_00335 [bacterium]|nr:hypothetical protein [bacterium]